MSSTSGRTAELTSPSQRTATQWWLSACGLVLLVAWTHRRELGAFFSPDDLLHLEHSAGLVPVTSPDLRVLSEVVYFTAMTRVFGPSPLAFHLAGLLVHLVNVVCLARLARGLSQHARVGFLAGALFGCSPLVYPTLLQAVTINDELALLCALLAIPWLAGRSTLRAMIGALIFWVAPLFKEAVLALPLVAYALRPPIRPVLRIRPPPGVWPLLAVLGPWAILLAMWKGGHQLGGVAYDLGGVGSTISNAAVYAAWATNLRDPLPDLTATIHGFSWAVLAGLAMLLIWAARVSPGSRRAIVAGLMWWMLGIAPVTLLAHHLAATYVYVALPGLALALAAGLDALASAFLLRMRGTRRADRFASVALAVVALLVTLRADALMAGRASLRVPGTSIALDPYTRKEETAAVAVSSFGEGVTPEMRRVAIISPPGNERLFGTLSGRAYPSLPGGAAYDLLRSVLDDGRALRVFFPQIDSVRWTSAWDASLADRDLFVVAAEGKLVGVGRAPGAHQRAAERLLTEHLDMAARNYLAAVIASGSEDAELRWLYGVALQQTGEPDSAMAQLRLIVAEAPGSPLAEQARRVLVEAERARGSRIVR